jgi:GntR family transcriptional repressor for pyruvate dehydrogenase complex
MPLEKQPDARVTATLISLLKKQIASGAIAPGDKFPPERELAKTFKVNRASMRQALKVLEIMGVLTQRIGDGTYLNNSAESLLREPLDFLVLLDSLSGQDLTETRLIVEPELTARAAERATAEDLAALRTAIVALERSKSHRERLQADFEFHDSILRAASNRIFHLLFRDIHRMVLISPPPQSATPPTIDQTLKSHRRIYAAIRARDAAEAREAMREHIVESSGSVEKQKIDKD